MRTSVITIVGLGPRGLTMLDRMVEAYQCFEPACNLEVHAVDPREPGQGVHYRQQPDHLVTNTIAGMITMFPHDGLMGEPRRPPGPSLPEWARLVGYRRFRSGFFPTGDDAGEEVSDHDYLPSGGAKLFYVRAPAARRQVAANNRRRQVCHGALSNARLAWPARATSRRQSGTDVGVQLQHMRINRLSARCAWVLYAAGSGGGR